MRAYLCGTPKEHCMGRTIDVTSGMGKTHKAHANPSDAFKCYSNWLVKIQGYVKMGSREFQRPGEPRLVLTKKSRFGGVMRGGKRGGENKSTRRATPKQRTSGIIIG